MKTGTRKLGKNEHTVRYWEIIGAQVIRNLENRSIRKLETKETWKRKIFRNIPPLLLTPPFTCASAMPRAEKGQL